MALDEVTYIYHGTRLEFLPSIARDGLLPSKPGPDGWPEFDEEDDLPEEAFEPRLFGDKSYSQAKGYADNYADGVVLRIRDSEDGIYWETGHTDWPYLYTSESVAPEHIDFRATDGNWQPVLSVLDAVAEPGANSSSGP